MTSCHAMCLHCRYLSDLHAPGDPAWKCIDAQHKWILQLMQNCRDEFISGQRGELARTRAHLCEVTVFYYYYYHFNAQREKPLFSISSRAASECHVSLMVGRRNPAASLLYQLFACIPHSVTTLPSLFCLRPACLFFHECMNKMKVREHWLWIWVSGLDMLLHTQTLFLTHTRLHRWIGTINPN